MSRLLESYGIEIIRAGPLNEHFLISLESTGHDLLLIDRYEDTAPLSAPLRLILHHWQAPVLFNDSMATELSLRQGKPEFGRLLAEQVYDSCARQAGMTGSPARKAT